MNIFKFKKYLIIALMLVILTISYYFIKENSKTIAVDPFSVSIDLPKIAIENEKVFNGNEITTTENKSRYLVIGVSILNITAYDFYNTSYTIELNDEVIPFIASQLITFSSDKFHVTTVDKAISNHSTSLVVSGFEHEWGMLLSTEGDLKDFHNLRSEDIKDYLKSIKVTIKWNGGEQVVEMPLTLVEIN